MTFRLELAMSVLRQTPFLLACVAILLAIGRWQRHSRVSLLASTGALLLLLGAGIALFWDLLYVRNPNVMGGLEAAERLVAWSVPLLQAAGLIFLMCAIFSDREAKSPTSDPRPTLVSMTLEVRRSA